MVREIKGWHVLAVTVGAFAIVIGVNAVLAVQAVRTFPGLEVENSYVASQSFDRERRAQQALGWTVAADYDGHELMLRILDGHGQPADVRSLSATIGRPTEIAQDQTPEFQSRGGGTFAAPLTLAPGIWNIHLTATAADGTVFRQRIDHYHGARVN